MWPVLVTPPVAEPISLEEAKIDLHVEHDDEDALIDALITAAREWCENDTGRALVEQTLRLSLDRFPCFAQVIELPRPHLLGIDSLTYVAPDGTVTALAAGDYQVDADSEPARLRPAPGQRWPLTQCERLNAVVITYRAGYPGADGGMEPDPTAGVPQAIRKAMRMLIGHWFINRQAVVTGTISTEVQFSVESLLGPHRVMGF